MNGTRRRVSGGAAYALVLLCIGLFPRDAAAYLDYGSGSYLFQIIIGFVLTVSLTFRAVWSRVWYFLKNLFNPRRDGPANPG